MKNPLIIAIVCIGLGFAAGWIAKPEHGIEQKIDEYLELLYEKNTYNLFIEDIRQEIRDLKTLLESK